MRAGLIVTIFGVGFAIIQCTPAVKANNTASSKSSPFFSTSVQDTFHIFTSIPANYKDSTAYPLILVLDANAYFDAVVAEFDLGRLTQGYPESIIVGVGYKDLFALDSLRARDYTFPVAMPQDSFAMSGGAPRYKQFIDSELLPTLHNKYNIDTNRIVIAGHSLAGYYVLYHFLEGKSEVSNFVAASPSLHYYNGYLTDKLRQMKADRKIKLYSSVGTLEFEPGTEVNHFKNFKFVLDSLKDPNIQYRFDEYSNFEHMDAAMPGFMKGLIFVFNQ
jgi:predicted alpha/beta superfamily hydrolase